MNYDESIYKEKANRRARKIWLVFAILLSANYGSDTANGLRTGPYYLTFLLLCWVPFIIGQILLKVKGMSTDWYKYGIAVGYGIFYSFVLITSPSNIAFTAGNQSFGFIQKPEIYDSIRRCQCVNHHSQCSC